MYMTIDEMWFDTIHALLNKNSVVMSQYGNTKEIVGFSKTLSSINNTFLLNPRRKLSPIYACAELLWYLKPTKSIEMIKAYAPQYIKWAENEEAYGAYGYRIAHNTKKNQLNMIIDLLSEEPNTRQAVLSIWNAHDLYSVVYNRHKDTPCTISLQFLVRGDKLHLITTMRSNDAWLGLPYDIFAFTTIQRIVGRALGVPCGTYTHQAGSEHLYEKNWSAAKEAINKTQFNPRLTHDWLNTKVSNWHGQIQRALCAEGRYRHKLSVSQQEHNALMQPLADMVTCCARKFNFDSQPIHSPILLEAFKNVNR